METSYPEFPLQRTCSHRFEPFQLTFAREAQSLLPARDDSACLASREGLILLGQTEAAFDFPLEVLRDKYKDALRVGPPMVRYRQEEEIKEPYMGVRVLCRARDFGTVKADLIARGAVIVDAEVTGQFGVVRATAPLARLLGYSERLAQMTQRTAREVMWLSHYAPVEPEPSGAA